jgi:predicted phosphatase
LRGIFGEVKGDDKRNSKTSAQTQNKAKDSAAILGVFAINIANALYEASFLIRYFHHFPILHPHPVPRHYIFAGADTPSTFKPFCNT